MALIRPCADLRNNYNEISRICHETNEPIYITKNGSSDLVILSNEVYENLQNNNSKKEEEKIEKLISEHFDKHYETFKDFRKDILSKINDAFQSISNGEGISMETVMKEMEEKYHLNGD